jgi:hypothetical protein
MKEKIIEILNDEALLQDEGTGEFAITEEQYPNIAERIVKLFAISVVSGSLPAKKYDIDFAGNVLAGIDISDNTPKIFGAINGYGDGIDIDKITITERQ